MIMGIRRPGMDLYVVLPSFVIYSPAGIFSVAVFNAGFFFRAIRCATIASRSVSVIPGVTIARKQDRTETFALHA